MGTALHDAYYKEYASEGHLAGVAPAGDAWLNAFSSGLAETNPYMPEAGKLNLWAIDSYHPSAWGAYLNACVIFEKITGIDARTLTTERASSDLGVSRATATALQKLAHDTVVANVRS